MDKYFQKDKIKDNFQYFYWPIFSVHNTREDPAQCQRQIAVFFISHYFQLFVQLINTDSGDTADIWGPAVVRGDEMHSISPQRVRL